MSTPAPTSEQLVAWRTFLETFWALLDILDAEMQEKCGLSLRWYDVLVHLEESPDGLPMGELATRMLTSKSGLTRVVDRMDAEGLVRRERPAGDRRVVLVSLTDQGRRTMEAARAMHRRGIQEHFLDHLGKGDLKALAAALEQVSAHVRPLRPGRVRG